MRGKKLKVSIDKVLSRTFKDKQGNVIEGAEALAKWLFIEALNGNVKAFEIIRDTTEGKPPKIINAKISHNQIVLME